MIRHKEFQLDGVTYITNQYTATRGLELQAKLMGVLGKPVGVLAGGGGDSEVTAGLIANALQALSEKVNERNIVPLVKEILETTTIQDQNGFRSIVFDTDFQGRYTHLFKLIREVLAYQFSDFLGVFAALKDAGAAVNRVKQTEAA